MIIVNDLVELYRYKSVLRALTTKYLFGNYKNSILGFGWHFVMPIVYLIVYYIVFSNMGSGMLPDFWIYLSCGLFPFHFMVNNLAASAGSLVNNSGLIKKMYFPRSIVIFSLILSAFIINCLGYLIVLFAIILSGFDLNYGMLLYLPLFFILMFIFVVGYSLILSAITVYIKDIQYLLSSMVIVFFFMTPMYFTVDNVTGLFAQVLWYNPFTYYVEAYHSLVYFGVFPEFKVVLGCVIIPVIFLIVGIAVFRLLKHGFAERL